MARGEADRMWPSSGAGAQTTGRSVVRGQRDQRELSAPGRILPATMADLGFAPMSAPWRISLRSKFEMSMNGRLTSRSSATGRSRSRLPNGTF